MLNELGRNTNMVHEQLEFDFGTDAIRDTQVGGEHYRQHAVQPWDAMESWLSEEEFCGFLRGNVIKYIARYRDKGGVQDLKKAAHYLDKLITEEMGR